MNAKAMALQNGPREVATTPDARPDALAFLNALHEGAEGFCEFRFIKAGKAKTQLYPLPLATLPLLVADSDIYFGVAPRFRKGGKATDVRVTCALWLDVDFKYFPDGAAGAGAVLGRLGSLAPSVVVATGHGEHWYWLLREPLSSAEARPLMRRLRHTVNPELDDVSDTPRILRVPGTFNHKNGERLPVMIVTWDPGRRFNPGDFDVLPAVPEDEQHGPAPPVEAKVTVGKRNDTLTSLAGTMRRRGMSHDAILAALREENDAKCSPPLSGAEVQAIASSVSRYEPAEGAGAECHLTDLGNARRFVELHGEDVRWVQAWRMFLVWDGRRFVRDTTRRVEQMARDVARSYYEQAAGTQDTNLRQALADHGRKCESERAIKAMVNLARSEPGIAINVDELDDDPWLLNCKNGTVDLHTGELREHRRSDLITKLAPVDFDPDATCELWDWFLNAVTMGDRELQDYIARVVGSALSGDVSDEKLHVVHGPMAGGKSTFIEAVKTAMGDYAQTADFSTFLVKRNHGGPQPGLARLPGARFVSSVEVDKGQKLAVALIKQLTGGEKVATNAKYGAEFEFKPQFKLFLVCNDRPEVPEDDPALWRRLVEIPFRLSLPPDEQDKTVKARLTDPAYAGAAILAWGVKGCLEWQSMGNLGPPECVLSATRTYRYEMDSFRRFSQECCYTSQEATVLVTELREAFDEWRKGAGGRDLTAREFNARLEREGFEQRRATTGGRKMLWNGVGLLAKDMDGG